MGAWQFYSFWVAIIIAACVGAGTTWLVIRAASAYEGRDYSGFKHHAKVHTFRIATAAATWFLIVAAFYYHAEWIKWGLRTITHGIESAAIPYPWGDRIEIALRELGGFVWFQITLAIVSLRILLSLVAAAWRRLR
jgi:magnesium-transporting ATPase (P-type)